MKIKQLYASLTLDLSQTLDLTETLKLTHFTL